MLFLTRQTAPRTDVRAMGKINEPSGGSIKERVFFDRAAYLSISTVTIAPVLVLRVSLNIFRPKDRYSGLLCDT